jgi:hypothetical protein
VAAALQLPQVAGRAILFATLMNADGFLAFMLANFTALSPALWILFRVRPDAAPPVGRRPAGPPPRSDS